MTWAVALDPDGRTLATWGQAAVEPALLPAIQAAAAAARAQGACLGRFAEVGPRTWAFDAVDLSGLGGGALVLVREDAEGERALARSEERYRALFEATGAATFTFGEDMVIRLVNSEFERQTGLARAEVVGRMRATDFVDPADVEGVLAIHRLRSDAPEQAPGSYEIRVRDGLGRPRVGIFNVKLVPGSGERVVSFVDVTEQRQAQEHVLRADKLAALGQLMGGLAHEIANPTNFIQFNLPILRRTLEAVMPLAAVEAARSGEDPLPGQPFERCAEDVQALLADIERGASRIAELIEQLRAHVRQGRPHPLAPGPVAPCVERAVALAGPQVRRTAALECALEPDLPSVLLDPGKLEQVMVNLLINAAQAARADGAWVRVTGAARGGVVELCVADNGAGIAPEQLSQVFDPFFTTKEQGTGLGLWICHRLVEEHGGRLEVDSTPGQGSRFRVLLPALP